MNIYVLDHDIELCAQYHCDRHVVEMIPGYVQILCAALNRRGFDTPVIDACAEHPCVQWAQASFDNFLWLKDLTLFLNDEYRLRFDRGDDHRSIKKLHKLSRFRFERHGLTPFPQVMPGRFRVPDDPVRAYRNFYIGEKLSCARWSLRATPDWIAQSLPASA